MIFFFMIFLRYLFPLDTHALYALQLSLDHLVRPAQHDCGIVTPICFAVLRLITSSNFVGCSTGRSAGLALSGSYPRNMATRRYLSARSAP